MPMTRRGHGRNPRGAEDLQVSGVGLATLLAGSPAARVKTECRRRARSDQRNGPRTAITGANVNSGESLMAPNGR